MSGRMGCRGVHGRGLDRRMCGENVVWTCVFEVDQWFNERRRI